MLTKDQILKQMGTHKKIALYDGEFYVHHVSGNMFYNNDKMFEEHLFICGVFGFPIVKFFDQVECYEIQDYFK